MSDAKGEAYTIRQAYEQKGHREAVRLLGRLHPGLEGHLQSLHDEHEQYLRDGFPGGPLTGGDYEACAYSAIQHKLFGIWMRKRVVPAFLIASAALAAGVLAYAGWEEYHWQQHQQKIESREHPQLK